MVQLEPLLPLRLLIRFLTHYDQEVLMHLLQMVIFMQSEQYMNVH